MSSNKKFTSSQRCTVLWMNSMAALAVGFSMSLIFLVVFAAPSLSWLLATLLIRGTLVIYWIVGLILILMGVFYMKAERILGKIGGAFANIVGESKAVPQSMRAGSGKALLRTVGEITTNIAVGQLIGILPTPYNIILFFLYYKTVTAIVICLIPVLFSLWALSMAWALRRELVKHLDDDERVPLVGDDGVEDIEAPRPKRNFGTSNTTQVHVSPQTRRVVPNYPIHSRDFTPDLQRSDTETAYTMRYDADTHNHPPNLYPRLNGHDE